MRQTGREAKGVDKSTCKGATKWYKVELQNKLSKASSIIINMTKYLDI